MQATFSTLQWTAAFAGFSGADYGTGTINNLIPIALVGWNTFCARILFGVSLPILLLAPFTLWLRFPSMRRYFEEEEAEVKKSESAETAAAVSGIAAKPGFSQADMANGELGRTRIQPI